MYGYIKPPGLSIWLRESSHRNRATIFSASLHGWVSPLQRNARVRQSTSHPEVYTGVIKRKVRLVVGDLLSLNSHQVVMLLPSFWARVVSRVSSEHVEGGFWKYKNSKPNPTKGPRSAQQNCGQLALNITHNRDHS